MSERPFRFKQFSVNQDRCAMKIGTDGVLLGAWVELNDESSALDIGSGSGLIALQLAQRSNIEVIDAIEIEPNAFEQTVENFENSDWADRLFCYHTSLQEFSEDIDEKYDLIISNPPFYNNTFKAKGDNRTLARHTDKLTFNELITSTVKLLSDNGTCAFIIPFEEETRFLEIAKENKLFPSNITRVYGNINSKIKRSLLQLSFKETKPNFNELVIEIERHKYTQEYLNLVKEFYLEY